jgi:quercetin dioxygenase-like cupin family protein
VNVTGEEIVLVPPHVHPTQDEHIDVLEGGLTLYVDGRWETAGPGDTVRMPRNIPHAYYNPLGTGAHPAERFTCCLEDPDTWA